MTVRVSSFQIHDLVQSSITKQEKGYADVIVQMSTGYKINTISDDPLGSVNLIGLERDQSAFDQYIKNANSIVDSLQQSEVYLDSSVNNLLRLKDLALQAVNGSNSDEDREAMAREVETIKTALLDLANSKDEDGNYLFSGSVSDTAPIQNPGPGWAYMGDAQERKVPISKGVDMPSVVTMSDAYFTPGNFFDKLDDFLADLNGGSPTIGATGPAIIDGVEDAIAGVGKMRTQIGARINTTESVKQSQEDLLLANDKIIGGIRDLDYAEAVNRINKLETSMMATQKTYSKVNELSLFNYI